MRKARVLAIICIALFPTFGFAKDPQPKAEPIPAARKIPPPPPADLLPFGVVRQDLFDRNNPNNLRSDYPAPPAQPGQF